LKFGKNKELARNINKEVLKSRFSDD